MPGAGAGTMRNVLTYCGLYTLGEQTASGGGWVGCWAVAGVADEIMAKLRRWGASDAAHAVTAASS